MAVDWTREQEVRVAELMKRHPLETGCAELGRALLPVARERDVAAAGLVVRAKAGQSRYPCIEPNNLPIYWFHHVTVGVLAHCVDALTGVPGTRRDVYFEIHFSNEPGDLDFDESDSDLEDPTL